VWEQELPGKREGKKLILKQALQLVEELEQAKELELVLVLALLPQPPLLVPPPTYLLLFLEALESCYSHPNP